MNPSPPHPWLEAALIAAALAQLGVAAINLLLERILHWTPALERTPLLLRQVHRVHAWFISLTLAIFAALTLRFASGLADGATVELRWLAGSIGVFWTVRVGLQWFYYSRSHWRGNPPRTAIHLASLVLFAAMATTYLVAATAIPVR